MWYSNSYRNDDCVVRLLKTIKAGMAELADALDSGSNGRKVVQVQVLLPAPEKSSSKDEDFSIIYVLLTGEIHLVEEIRTDVRYNRICLFPTQKCDAL